MKILWSNATESKNFINMTYWNDRKLRQRVWSTPSLPLLPGQLQPVVIVPVRVCSFGEIDMLKKNIRIWLERVQIKDLKETIAQKM